MAQLAQNTRLRLTAVLILLALRPCVIFLSAQFLSSQSGNDARIEYIDDDLAIENVAITRDVLLVVQNAAHLNAAFAVPRVALRWVPGVWFILWQRVSPRLAQLPVPLSAGRAPPYSLA